MKWVYWLCMTLKAHPLLQVEYIWNRPWTIVKVMFLVNRYGNLIGQTSIRLEEAGLLSHGSQMVCCSFTSRHPLNDMFKHPSSATASLFSPLVLWSCLQSRFIVRHDVDHSSIVHILHSVIVLMRAWAIWGTQKRVANILIWSYVSYVLVLTGTATYSMTTRHSRLIRLFILLFAKWLISGRPIFAARRDPYLHRGNAKYVIVISSLLPPNSPLLQRLCG